MQNFLNKFGLVTSFWSEFLFSGSQFYCVISELNNSCVTNYFVCQGVYNCNFKIVQVVMGLAIEIYNGWHPRSRHFMAIHVVAYCCNYGVLRPVFVRWERYSYWCHSFVQKVISDRLSWSRGITARSLKVFIAYITIPSCRFKGLDFKSSYQLIWSQKCTVMKLLATVQKSVRSKFKGLLFC